MTKVIYNFVLTLNYVVKSIRQFISRICSILYIIYLDACISKLAILQTRLLSAISKLFWFLFACGLEEYFNLSVYQLQSAITETEKAVSICAEQDEQATESVFCRSFACLCDRLVSAKFVAYYH